MHGHIILHGWRPAEIPGAMPFRVAGGRPIVRLTDARRVEEGT
jgi:hypothetical protein